MAWFKVDDKLHSHKKAARAGVAAIGLWTVAGSWSSDHLTDGFIPDYIATRLAGGDAEQLAARLVDAGLWFPAEHDGDTGWRFKDWDEYQPTREHVEAKREAERDKKRTQRRNPRGQFRESRGESPGDTRRESRGESDRPDPTRPVPPENTPAANAADEPGFDDFWSECPRKLDKGHARKAWKQAVRKSDPTTIIEAMRSHAEFWRIDKTDPKFIPYPATWLNGERWQDELESSDEGPPEFRRDASIERNQRRARGEACDRCNDTGWVEDEHGTAHICRHREAS